MGKEGTEMKKVNHPSLVSYKVVEVGTIIGLSLTILTGALVFGRGFLLNRQVLDDKSQAQDDGSFGDFRVDNNNYSHPSISAHIDWYSKDPSVKKTILILVDALRHDFLPRMKFLNEFETVHSVESYKCAFKFMADPPTTTMQRLKALMTGTIPTFLDASANFNSYEVGEDSLIYQFHQLGKRIAFLGDDTWLSLFKPELFQSPFVEGHPSFDAWDLDTVDRAVNSSLHRILHPDHQNHWDIILAHFLGVDHCGHRYGPSHPEMNRKLKEADDSIKSTFEMMTEDTLLVVFGDHGMTRTGDHGGDSKLELESAVVFLSKNPEFVKRSKCSNKPKDLEVSQVDLVPTLSTLIGVPIPFSSIGQLIEIETSEYFQGLLANVAQVNRFVKASKLPTQTLVPATDYAIQSQLYDYDETIIELFERLQRVYVTYITDPNMETQTNLQELARLYLSSVKEVAVSMWTQFDVPVIIIGIGITTLSIVALLLGFSNSKFCLRTSNYVWALPSLGVMCSLIQLTPTYRLIVIVVTSYLGLILYISSMVLGIGTYKIKSSKCSKLFRASQTKNLSKGILSGSVEEVSVILFGATCLGVFSNSFVINEGYVLGYVVGGLCFIEVLSSSHILKNLQNKCELNLNLEFLKRRESLSSGFNKLSFVKKVLINSCGSCICLCLFLRLGHIFFRCREELQNCTEEYLLHKQLASLPTEWVVHKYVRFGIALVSLAIMVVILGDFLQTRNSLRDFRPAALVGKYVPSLLVVLTGVFWALEGLPFGIAQLPQTHIQSILQHFPDFFQFIALTSMTILWTKPLCCVGATRYPQLDGTKRLTRTKISSPKLSAKNGDPSPSATTPLKCEDKDESIRIENGHSIKKTSEDVFSTPILVHGILETLLLVLVSSSGITPALTMIPYSLVFLASIFRNPSKEDSVSWSAVIVWTLACQYYMYATGHQPVFSTIPWDSAFTMTANNLGTSAAESWFTWVRPALSVIGNIYVSQILFSLGLPLLVYWRGNSAGKPESLMGRRELTEFYKLSGKFLALHGIKLLSCMISAMVLRRHLMVWKIFAPRFIFEVISFVITFLATSMSMIFVTRVDSCYRSLVQKEIQQIDLNYP